MTDKPRYNASIIYSGWLIDQHTWLFIWVDCMTNIPAYLTGLTNSPIYLTIQVFWLTSIPTYLSGLTKTYQQTGLSMWVDWLAYLSRLSDWLSLWVDWMTITPAYQYLTICLGWLYDHYISLSIQVDCTTNIPDYISGLTNQPTNQPIYPGWLTDQQTSLSDLIGMIDLTIYPSWLTNQHTCLRYLPSLTDWSTYQPIHQGLLTDQHTSLFIRVHWQTDIPDYLSWLIDWSTYQPIHQGRLTG